MRRVLACVVVSLLVSSVVGAGEKGTPERFLKNAGKQTCGVGAYK